MPCSISPACGLILRWMLRSHCYLVWEGLHETRTTLPIFEYGAIGEVMAARNLYGWTSVWNSPRRLCVLGEGRNSRYQI
jgi:hypothetical protein